jgi:hypothetical protein
VISLFSAGITVLVVALANSLLFWVTSPTFPPTSSTLEPISAATPL